ncbi:MAG: hypothetical protein CMO40_02175 [Verrucomicrobiaceae bacterium]|nr:hypothetical protein [Verrucomicrobiaceae bacterium]
MAKSLMACAPSRGLPVVMLLILLPAAPLQALPMITEFLAANDTVLADEDGDFSDWIEVFNPDSTPIDLGGHYLTDDAANLTKWQFPSGVTLGPSKFLLVFASDKDRGAEGSELHANFKLAADGEYLALVAPDGSTVLHDYSPAFPVQFDDASYGLEQLGDTTEETLVSEGDACEVLVPTNGNLGTSWTQVGFNDAIWTSGTLGVGYERSSGYQDFINVDVESQMYGSRTGVYIRIPFTLADAGEISALRLEMQFDDGFVAYLNGTRVEGANDPPVPAYNSSSSGENLDANAVNFEPFSLNAHVNALLDGTNVLAIHGLNRSTTSSDLLIRPRLIATRLTDPALGGPGYFLDPSPGAPNGTEQGLPASEVTISDMSKAFTSSFQVSLSGAAAGQSIRYTLDGSAPTAGSPVYGAPITISNSTQLRARVFGANDARGPIAMETYLRLSSDLQNFSSNLPILILENWGAGRPGTGSPVDGFWAIIEPDAATNNRAEMLDPFHIATRVGMKRRGSSSAGWPKYSLTLESRDEEGLDRGIRPLGLPRESDWVLSGRYTFDHALMRNPLIYRLSNEAGEYAVRTRFVEVINNTGGGNLSYSSDYFGVYTFMEKIKRDNDRVNVARMDTDDLTEPDVSGGYLFKKDRLDPGDGGFSVNTMGRFGWVEPKEDEVAPAQSSWLRGHLNELDAALYSSNWTHPATGKHFTEYLDQFSWLRHHWCNTLAMNVDGFRLSGYYYKHRSDTNGGRLGAGPIWDFDRTMGSKDNRDNNPQAWDGTGDSSRTWSDSRYPWWGRALTNPDFRQAHTDLWQELREEVFSTGNIHSIIDEFAAQIDYQGAGGSPAARNSAKWGTSNHASEVNILKNWLQTRANWIDSQYTAQPGFTTAPGVVPAGTLPGLSGGGGTTYYTLDGTDPRLPGGNISPSAMAGSPGPIASTTVVTARARNGTGLTSWSGPLRGTFLVGPIATAANFAITEVHYAPLPPGTPAELAAANDAAEFEFIEMKNTSMTDTIDLTGVHLADGVDFSFTGSNITSLAPGASVLLVSNQAAFEARYTLAYTDRIAGEFAPSRLDNAGERIHLVDALGNSIADFTYDDKPAWPSESGYAGYSMVLKSTVLPGADYTDASNWRSSTRLGGNPATSDSSLLVGSPTADDDGDRYGKLLEHALGTSDSDPGDSGGTQDVAVMSLLMDDVRTDYLTVSHRRNLAADDVTIVPEVSADLLNWRSGDDEFILVSEVHQGDGTSLVTYRTSAPHDPIADPRVFIRLKVSN